ncbi:hypothetical protein RJT34_32055 [Clitoria ternatea]|uniref:Uncharacterized protein n=1 Tax=Clitoria ternatea TaxID=43366 RepID=A0AAN9I915_CLITE
MSHYEVTGEEGVGIIAEWGGPHWRFRLQARPDPVLLIPSSPKFHPFSISSIFIQLSLTNFLLPSTI